MRLCPGKVWLEIAAFCNCLRNAGGEFKVQDRRTKEGNRVELVTSPGKNRTDWEECCKVLIKFACK